MTLSLTGIERKVRYAECRIFIFVYVSVITLNVVRLSVVAPTDGHLNVTGN
jgi:hypothetical protein